MTTVNQIGLGLSGASGTGSFIGSNSPTITTPRIAQINDASGNAAIALTAIGSANYWAFSNAGALGGITVTATGSDSNIDINHVTKGTGQFKIAAWNLTQPLVINSGTSGQRVTTFQMANTSASYTYTLPDASGTVLISGTAINSVPSITFSSTSGVIGSTTNDSAAAGSVGELISSVIANASATSLSTGTAANVTSISLTAGDWDVYGNVTFVTGAGTTVAYTASWISTSSAAVPDSSLYASTAFAAGQTFILNTGGCVPGRRLSLSGTTTVYLGAQAGFAVSTCGASGGIYARRRR